LVRCFICVEITNGQNINLIDTVLEELRKIKGIRPVKLSQLHITLKFLGEIPEYRINTIKQTLVNVSVSPFSLSFSKLGCFPNKKRPRVIWIGIDQGYEELRLLAGEVDQRLSELGFPKEKRRFSPHLTLARVKRLTPEDKEVLSDLLKNFTFRTGTSEEITTLVFKKSTLTPKGAIYENLAEYNLI
jgi:2'-5' RNA ligase